MSDLYASAIAADADLEVVLRTVVSAIRAQLDGPADLAAVFLAADFVAAADEIAGRLSEEIPCRRLIGVSAESLVGTNTELEALPGLSVWAARLPHSQLTLARLEFVQTADGPSFTGWPEELPEPLPADSTVLLLGDPFSFPADYFAQRFNEDHPHVPLIGGMASAGQQPGENRLLLDNRVFREGAVAVILRAGVRVRPLVSQGCRPIGEPLVITKAEGNLLLELGGQPALQRLLQIGRTLSTSEQKLVRRGLHLGRVVNEYQDRFEQGDFLVRNVVGVDPGNDTVVVGDQFRVGQTVQFHVRDADTADGELRRLLAAARAHQPRAALLFTCNGRGTRLFAQPHHDAAAIQASLGPLPLAGLFAAGELGPIGGQNFLHGFTASTALFGDP